MEEVIYEHPAVREAAVIGVPHDELGEEIAAAVALKPGAEVTESELRGRIKANIAADKYPRHVWFVEELPKGRDGKDPQARNRGAGGCGTGDDEVLTRVVARPHAIADNAGSGRQ